MAYVFDWPIGTPTLRAAAAASAWPKARRAATSCALRVHMAARADAGRRQLYARVHMEW